MNRSRSTALARLGALLLAHSLGSAFVAADIIRVPGDYPTIQEAIDAAVDGDEVYIDGGTYHEAIDFLGKSIRVLGAPPPYETIIDGSLSTASVVTFQSNEPRGAILERCTIRHGVGTWMTTSHGSEQLGGGLLIRSAARPSIVGCTIERNVADRGGGAMIIEDADPLFRGVRFDSNFLWGRGSGGGACVDDGASSEFSGCRFVHNVGGSGGGLGLVDAVVRIAYCSFEFNTATRYGGGGVAIDRNRPVSVDIYSCSFISNLALWEGEWGVGGAILSWGRDAWAAGPPLQVRSCDFTINIAKDGGAVGILSRSMLIEDSDFRENEALSEGGAVYGDADISSSEFNENRATLGGALYSCKDVSDSLFLNNSAIEGGGAIYRGGAVNGCRFDSNRVDGPDGRGGAIYYNLRSAVEHCVFAGNLATVGGAVWNVSNVRNSLFFENIAERGAAVAASVDTVIYQCTFAHNRAPVGETVFGDETSIVLAGSILWDNEGAAIGPQGSSFTVQECIVEGGIPWMETGCTSLYTEDPRFFNSYANDYRLRAGSPAIDRGHPYEVSEFDLAAAPRRRGPFQDIGAYEFQLNDRGFTIRAPVQPLVGSAAELPFGGARPGDRVYFAYALRTGRGEVSICPGVFTDLEAPVEIGIGVADEHGAGFSPRRRVREAARGRVMYFQALNLDTCEVSNLVSHYWR
ncbi:MAG: right-handed parallel beta-helix repeat-containing protein [Phycisphaerales bacterium]